MTQPTILSKNLNPLLLTGSSAEFRSKRKSSRKPRDPKFPQRSAKKHQPLHFHVTYWMFYPFSEGKAVCVMDLGFLGSWPLPRWGGVCFGQLKEYGSHVGDWEHVSLYFKVSSIRILFWIFAIVHGRAPGFLGKHSILEKFTWFRIDRVVTLEYRSLRNQGNGFLRCWFYHFYLRCLVATYFRKRTPCSYFSKFEFHLTRVDYRLIFRIILWNKIETVWNCSRAPTTRWRCTCRPTTLAPSTVTTPAPTPSSSSPRKPARESSRSRPFPNESSPRAVRTRFSSALGARTACGPHQVSTSSCGFQGCMTRAVLESAGRPGEKSRFCRPRRKCQGGCRSRASGATDRATVITYCRSWDSTFASLWMVRQAYPWRRWTLGADWNLLWWN